MNDDDHHHGSAGGYVCARSGREPSPRPACLLTNEPECATLEYTSEMIGSSEQMESMLNEIIEHSQKANDLLGITGILLHNRDTKQARVRGNSVVFIARAHQCAERNKAMSDSGALLCRSSRY